MNELKNILKLSYYRCINKLAWRNKAGFFNPFVVMFTCASLLLLYFFPEYFKLFLFFCGFLFIVFFLLSKNVLYSLFTLLFITQHFLVPGKYYSFVLFDIHKIRAFPYYNTGIIEGYGLIASDIFALLTLLYIIRIIVVTSSKEHGHVLFVLKAPFTKLVLLCWTVYFFISLYASLQYSFNLTFSIVNLLQYGKLIVFYLGAGMVLANAQKGWGLLVSVISGISIANAVLAGFQFISDFKIFSLGERYTPFYSSPEANARLSTLSGTYIHQHEFAFFLLLWSVILGYVYMQTKQKWLVGVIFLNMLSIILSQSRSVWTILFLIIFFLYFLYKSSIQKALYNNQKLILRIIICATITAFMLGPRLLSLQYTLDDGSGSIRLQMLAEGFETLKQNPWVGFGVRSGMHILNEYFPRGYLQDFPREIHMAYLQMALESGVLGVFFFFLPFLLALRGGILNIARGDKRKNLYLVCVLLFGSVFLYYTFQPNVGRHDIPLLGIILSIYMHATLYEKNNKF